jgi:hypothetical protein
MKKIKIKHIFKMVDDLDSLIGVGKGTHTINLDIYKGSWKVKIANELSPKILNDPGWHESDIDNPDLEDVREDLNSREYGAFVEAVKEITDELFDFAAESAQTAEKGLDDYVNIGDAIENVDFDILYPSVNTQEDKSLQYEIYFDLLEFFNGEESVTL